MSRQWRTYALSIVFVLAVVVLPTHAFAASATWYVNAATGSDSSGDGSSGNPYQSFNKAYTVASTSGDTINLTGTFDWSSSSQPGSVVTSGFTISKSLIITGSGAATSTIIQASSTPYTANRKIFTVTGSANVTFQNLTLRYGYLVLDSAATAVDIGTTGKVSMQSVIITQNANTSRYASGAVQLQGGSGAFTMTNSTIYNNGSTTLGAWPGYTAGIEFYNANVANVITNSTVYNNASGYQGGIYVDGTNVKLTITNSTFANNYGSVSATDVNSYGGAKVYLKNNIFAKKQLGGANNLVGQSTSDIVDDGYNIVETQSNTGMTNGTNNDLVGVQSSLNFDTGLQTNNATSGVPTLAILSSSVAIDAGDASIANNGVNIPQSDERGLYRSGAVDLGAYEYNGSNTPINDTTAPTVSLTAPIDGSTVGATTTLAATASDMWGVAGVKFYVDGALTGSEITSAPYTTSFDTTSIAAGSHTFVAVARDTSNNYATSTTANVTIVNAKPVISAIATSTTSTTATITWTTDKSASSTISYGTTVGYGLASTSAAFVPSHSITLTSLSSNTTYHFKIGSADTYGNATTTGDYTFKTAVSDAVPPTVSLTLPVASEATSSTMTLAANASDNVAVAGVTFYVNGVKQGSEVTSAPYATTYNTTATTSGAHTAFAVARDTSNNYATSSVISFTVSNPGPSVTSISVSTTTTSAIVGWTTGTTSTSVVNYGATTGYGFASSSVVYTTSHSVTISGLTSATTYHYQISSTDAEGNATTTGDYTFTTATVPDTTPPVISGIASSTTATTATVTWTTNEVASSTVLYGATTSYGTASSSSAFVPSHSILITGLSPSTAYHFEISTADPSNNVATSSDYIFTTTAVSIPTPSSVVAVGVAHGATVTWTTSVVATSRIWFGLTSTYSSSTLESDTSPRVLSHSLSLSGLPSCAVYHYAVTGSNISSVYATSTDATFTTAGCTGSASVTASNVLGIATSTGGTVTQGVLTLTVPTNFTATSSSAVFEANQLDRTSFFNGAGAPAGVSAAASAVFNLKALTDASTTLSTFTAPLMVTLAYSPSDISGLVETSLQIYRYDSGTGWNALPNCVVDTVAHTVTCNTSNFSDFAIFGTAAVVTSGGTNTTTASGGSGMIYGSSPLAPGYQVGVLAIATSTATTPTVAATGSAKYTFTRNLRQGSTGTDVKALQQYLNAHGFTVAAKGVGSAGAETTYYGPATAKAVSALQVANAQVILAPSKLTKGTGLFANATRAFVNAH